MLLNAHDLSQRLISLLAPTAAPPVVLCIGSDRVTGDCLGPLTGHLLASEFNVCAFVYGTLARPVTALNLTETAAFIKLRHPLSAVIAVDSSLGNPRDVGQIRVLADGIFPGAAAGKRLPKVGDVSVTATVAGSGNDGLYGARLGQIYALSKTVAAILANGLKPLALRYTNIITSYD
jgi:putative sporulation protein YyaC